MSSKKRSETVGELIGNSVSHGVSVFLGIVFFIVLLHFSENTLEYISSFFFGIGVIFLTLMSTLYHALIRTGSAKVFKRLDHSAIYLLIVCTYMPYLLLAVNDAPNIVAISIMGGVGLLGIIFKSINPYKLHFIHLILYIALGWVSMLFAGQINEYSHKVFMFLLYGGISYTIGAILYAFGKFKFAHMIWHFFVFFGIFFHFISVLLLIMV